MSDEPLSTLEAVRRNAVDALARELRQARAVLTQQEDLVAACRSARSGCERRLEQERRSFASGSSVCALLHSEGCLRALESELAALRQRELRAGLALQRARAEIDALSAALLAAERGRRVAATVLERKRSESHKRKERAEEEAGEEAFRTRR